MKLRILFSGIIAMLLLAPTTGFGQVCTPDPTFTTPGFFPDSLPPACVGIPYQTTLTLVVPLDTTVAFPPLGTFTLPIDSITLDDVLGAPATFSYGCNPGSCTIAGGATGCIGITGTGQMADTINLRIAITTYVVSPLGPLTLPDTIDGLFTLYINPGFTTAKATTDASCGSTDGTAKITAAGGSGSFTYLWSNGATTDSIGALSAGVYTVVTTDASGCTKTDTFTVNTNGSNPVLATDTAYWAGCSSTGSGIITVSSTGGDGNYMYSWSNGASTDSIGGLANGTYTVTVTDGLGCSDFETITITQPSELILNSVSTTDIDCNGDNSGEIQTAISGGVGAYAITWTSLPNETGPIVSNLPAGMYDIMVEDEAGCMKTLNFTLSEPDAITVAFTFSGETAFNQNDGKAKAVVSGGVSPYTYAWDNAATTDSIGDLMPGMYVLTITDANGCVKMDSVEIPSVAQSIEGQLGITAFTVAPNPTSGNISLNWDLGSSSEATLRLRDLRGALLKDWGIIRNSGSLTDQLALPAGVYLIEVETETGKGFRKLMIQ